jgi:hypothetical protein
MAKNKRATNDVSLMAAQSVIWGCLAKSPGKKKAMS